MDEVQGRNFGRDLGTSNREHIALNQVAAYDSNELPMRPSSDEDDSSPEESDSYH